jgi:hypothetical protein
LLTFRAALFAQGFGLQGTQIIAGGGDRNTSDPAAETLAFLITDLAVTFHTESNSVEGSWPLKKEVSWQLRRFPSPLKLKTTPHSVTLCYFYRFCG